MQHVIFARDRKRRKNRIKAFLFLMAIAFLSVGIVLTVNKSLPPSDKLPAHLGTMGLKGYWEVALASPEMAKEKAPEGVAKNEEMASTSTEVTNPEESAATDIEPDEVVEIDNHNSFEGDEYVDQDDEVEVAEKPEQAVEPDAEATETEADPPVTTQTEKLSPEAEEAVANILDVADEAMRIREQFGYTVENGDKLRDVFEQSGVDVNEARALQRRFPELAKLSAGQQFYGVLDNDGRLEYLNWLVSEKEERVYERKANGQFAVQQFEKKGEWRQDVIRGTLVKSFAESLKNSGLSARQVQQLAAGLQSQIAVNNLKKGDRFALLVKREYVEGKATDTLGNVEGIHIVSGKKSYYAIQADNGRYYAKDGASLGSGFARQPLLFTARVSSPYNPRRLHPITRRVRPHNGTDFGLPVGTPIIAPSDGVVEHIAFQARGAGRYIKLRHGHITTVYMHLSKTLVKVGQTVRKGDRIALSGNTGASTGPHLHYEFHINGRPVNPMTVKLPGSGGGMADKERKNFLARAKTVEQKLKF